jgi:hypothetical protein
MMLKKWEVFTRFKEQMFEQTSTEKSPWVVINSNLKMAGRLNAMLYVLQKVQYDGKKTVVPLAKNRMLYDRDVDLLGVRFYDFNFKQSRILTLVRKYLSGTTLEDIEKAVEPPEPEDPVAANPS